jgi:hypothetical protein
MNSLFPSSAERLDSEDCARTVGELLAQARAIEASIGHVDDLLGKLISAAPASIGRDVIPLRANLRSWGGMLAAVRTLLDVASFENGEYKRIQEDSEKLKRLPVMMRIVHAPDYAKFYLYRKGYLRRLRSGLEARRNLLAAVASSPGAVMRMVPSAYWIPLLASVPFEDRAGLLADLKTLAGKPIDLKSGPSEEFYKEAIKEYERLHESMSSVAAAVSKEHSSVVGDPNTSA